MKRGSQPRPPSERPDHEGSKVGAGTGGTCRARAGGGCNGRDQPPLGEGVAWGEGVFRERGGAKPSGRSDARAQSRRAEAPPGRARAISRAKSLSGARSEPLIGVPLDVS